MNAENQHEERENHLRQTQKMESVGTIVGAIAHDFNNILTVIIGFGELALAEAEKGTNLYDNIGEVLQGGYRARELVRQILTFSRRTESDLRPVNLEPVVRDVLETLRTTLPPIIELQPSIQKNLAPVEADPIQIQQIVMNLCTNAEHAMQGKGGELIVALDAVTLEADFSDRFPDLAPGSYLKLTVGDTGSGISPDVIEHIFEPYFTTRKKGVGTGMGLAVVQGIVRKCGGEITIDSELGKGSTFTVYLPQVKREVVSDEATEAPIDSGHERILFVDDEVALTKLAKKMLRQLGYTVTTRTSSIEALELFKTIPHRFDLVITDKTMPNMTGDQMAVEMMKVRPDMPVILCTGFSEQVTREDVKAMGIRTLLMKPIVWGKLAKTVREALDTGDPNTA